MNSLGLSIIFRMGCLCSREKISIKGRKYFIQDVIGEGGFSTVYLVEDCLSHKMYAVKKIICHSMDDQAVAIDEVKIHEKIKSDHVISLIDYEVQGTPDPVTNLTSQICLILPYYRRGTLHSELERRATLRKPFEATEVLEMFFEVCQGVLTFHECPIPLAHRDLKTANILLDDDDTPVIMDLGSATAARVQVCGASDAQSLQDLAAERCSMPYKAPELFNVEAHCIIDERTDIWSLGCILYAICFFKSPFDAVYERGDSVALAVLSGNIHFPKDHIYGEDMENLIKFMLKVNPMERPYIYSVIQKTQDTLRKYSSSV